MLERVDQADTLLTIDCVRFDLLPVHEPLRAAIERDGVALLRESADE